MRVLVTGSSGHLGEALVRTLAADGLDVTGVDIVPSPHTSLVGSIADRPFVRSCLEGVDAVIHAATLHKPHIGSHSKADFLHTNVEGTLNLLEEAVAAGTGAFVYTSTTSAFGRALVPPAGEPASWITEETVPVPRNVYGVTKIAAEDLCELVWRDHGLPCVILRTSRFFPEGDDDDRARAGYDDLNLKVNELLHRRVDIEDVVSAHRMALERAASIGFGRYIVTATTPFRPEELGALRSDTAGVVRRLFPHYEEIYAGRGWAMLPEMDRVYVNTRARADLGWQPKYDFAYALECLGSDRDPRSPLARSIGRKGYHPRPTGDYTAD